MLAAGRFDVPVGLSSHSVPYPCGGGCLVKLGVSQSLVQSDTWLTIASVQMSRAELSYLSCAASWTVPSRWACGRGGGGGC